VTDTITMVYFNETAHTPDPIASIPNAVLITDASGVPQFSAELPAGTTVPAVFVQTQTVSIANTVTETDLTGTGAGSLTLPANFFDAAGETLLITGFGYHSATGNPTLQIRIYFGTTVILDTGTDTVTGNSTNDAWDIRAMVTCRSTGVSGSVIGQGRWTENGGGLNRFQMVNTSPTTLDTTIAQVFKMTIQWGTADPGNSITMTNFTLEQVFA
jgi:hypothetical protein